MTDKKIIKALECCSGNTMDDCEGCPRLIDNGLSTVECMCQLMLDALDLINRRKAEIKEWKRVVETWQELHEKDKAEIERLQNYKTLYEDLKAENLETIRCTKTSKSEAIKEYKNKVENDIVTLFGKSNCTEFIECLDYRYKEMVGEE